MQAFLSKPSVPDNSKSDAEPNEMSEVIRFLESMATTAFSPGSDADLTEAVAELEIPHEQKKAVAERDPSALSRLLGGRTQMFFGLVAPEREQPYREDEGEETPDQAPDEPDQPV